MKKSIITLLFCYFSSLSAGTIPELKQNTLNGIAHLPGWCSEEKALSFIDLVLQVKPKICVEIGVYSGRSLFPVASALKFLGQGIVIGIDPWDTLECIKHFDPIKDAGHFQWWSKESQLEQMRQICLNMIKRNGLEDHCKIIRATSQKAAHEIDGIDILHLDGNHSESVSIQDVKLYLPKVRSGGYIWINDTTWDNLYEPWELLSEACDVVKAINTDAGVCVLLKKR